MRQGGHRLPHHRQFSGLDQLVLRGAQIGLNRFSLANLLFQLLFLRIKLTQGMTKQTGNTSQLVAPVNRNGRLGPAQTNLHHRLIQRGKAFHQPRANKIMVQPPCQQQRQQGRHQD